MSDVKLENVSYTVGQTTILDSVSLLFKKKSLTCILGPNGAGKTTLIKAICRIVTPSGQVYIDGMNTAKMSPSRLAREVSYVPQSLTSNLAFSVEDFILLSRYPWQGVSELKKSQLEEVLTVTGIQNHRQQSMKTLSGGERQRALIAAALIQDTPVILLDEISSALDPRYQHQIVNLLTSIRDRGKTLIWATHDINAALLHADTLLAMQSGKKFASGTAAEFLEQEILQRLYGRKFERLLHPRHHKTILV